MKGFRISTQPPLHSISGHEVPAIGDLSDSNTSGWTKTTLADDRRSYMPLLQVNRYTQRLKNEDNRKWLNPYAQARQECHFVYNKHYNYVYKLYIVGDWHLESVNQCDNHLELLLSDTWGVH